MVQVHLGPPVRSFPRPTGGDMFKKLLVLAAAAAGAFAIWRKVSNDKAEQDLWNEAVADLDSDAPVVDLR